MSIRTYIDQELEGLDDAGLRLVAEFVAFLKIRAYLNIPEEQPEADRDQGPGGDGAEREADADEYAWLR